MDDSLPRRARLHGGVATLPSRLVASWRRSEDYGVSLESVDPAFTGTYVTESLFVRCGEEVLEGLRRNLGPEPISVMLTDADGLVLSRHSGDHALLRSLDAVHLAPGFSYAEREAGTNGLGLALADRAPTVVRAEEHYAMSLTTYTCAAVPVLHPQTGRLEGCVNLTTWSKQSSDLLLALAHSAASTTTALMLARAVGRTPRPTPRGEVFRVEVPRLEPGSGTLHDLGAGWTTARVRVERALAERRVVAVVGEPGSGRTTLLAQAERRHRPASRILAAAPPPPEDPDLTERWLEAWTPEVGKPHTAVIARDVDVLPTWVVGRLGQLLTGLRTTDGQDVPMVMTAERFEDIPAPMAGLVDTVVSVPPLRERPEDVVPLARHVARRARGREIEVSPVAGRALENHSWPGNVTELVEVVRAAARHTDLIDLRDLPAALLSGTRRRLSRIEAFERDEIVRVLSERVTMREAAEQLGMSRATLYRKLSHLEISIPRGEH